MLLFVVLCSGLINFPRTQTKSNCSDLKLTCIYTECFIIISGQGIATNKPIIGGGISLFKKVDIKIFSSLAVSDTGTLNSDTFKFLTCTRQVLNTYQRPWPYVLTFSYLDFLNLVDIQAESNSSCHIYMCVYVCLCVCVCV